MSYPFIIFIEIFFMWRFEPGLGILGQLELFCATFIEIFIQLCHCELLLMHKICWSTVTRLGFSGFFSLFVAMLPRYFIPILCIGKNGILRVRELIVLAPY